MAATRLIALHVNKGKTVAQCLADRTGYAQNGDKTDGGRYVSSYECDPRTADEEFLLSKRQYEHLTGRRQKSDVIAYQIRQSFKPGEATPEEANKVGYELAMRFTRGRHAFLVATHVDKAHVHNHIIFNSTTLDCRRKFKDFYHSGLALQRASDIVCLSHGLSVIGRGDEPKVEKGRGRGNAPAVGRPSGGASQKEARQGAQPHGERLRLPVDIQEKIREGKGEGYARWAKSFNLKQMARAVCFLQENGIGTIGELRDKADEAVSLCNGLGDSIKAKEERLREIAALKTHIANYAKTRDAYGEYRKSGYSKKFYEEHREAISIHKAAKEAFDRLGVKKIPRVRELSAEYAAILSEKKEEYARYQQARRQMQEYLVAQKIVEMICEGDGERREQKGRDGERGEERGGR